MNFEQKQTELKAIYEMYTTLGHLKPLYKRIELESDHLTIEWLDHCQDEIYVDLNGWYVKSAKQKTFPTFEGLCMWRNERFAHEWGVQLDKLLNS